MIINILISITAWLSKYNKWSYLFTIMMSHLLNNAIMTLFPISVAKTFGMKYGIEVYAIVCIFWGSNALTNLLFIMIFNNDHQWGNLYVYFICAICIIFAMIVNYYFNEKLDVESMEKKGKIILAD